MRVFKSEKEGSWPYFLFYVDSAVGSEAGTNFVEVASVYDEPRVVRRSEDGKHVVREHIVRMRQLKLMD
jgi:hypothetical protein